MTTLIIKSNSEKKTRLLIQLAEELGLSAQTQNFKKLNLQAMVTGIGRKATDEELIDYLTKETNDSPISLEIAFSKFETTNH